MTTIDNDSQERLQRELADKITSIAPLNDIRILLACGAKVNIPVTQGLTPLHYAVYRNYIDCVHMLLVRGSEVNALDEVGYSAVHLCAEYGNYQLMQLLLKHQANVCFVDPDREKHIFPRDYKCDEPLRLAVKNDHFECARLLLENGANPNARYFFGSEITFLSPGNAEFLHLLLIYGSDPNVYDRDGLTPLMKACRAGNTGMKSVKLLIQFGAYANALAFEKQDLRTPLHYAILSGNMEMVQYLIECGVRINMTADYDKPSPLDLAVLKGQPGLVRLLLENGADPNAVYTYIGSPLHLVCCSEIDDQFELIMMLLEMGANPNLAPRFPEGGHLKTPLVEYVRSSPLPEYAPVQLMLQYGGQVFIQSPLHNPRGHLRNLIKVAELSTQLFDLLIDAAQYFDREAVQRLPLPIDFKMRLIEAANQPLSLRHLSRLAVREAMMPLRPQKIHILPLPEHLKKYLLYK